LTFEPGMGLPSLLRTFPEIRPVCSAWMDRQMVGSISARAKRRMGLPPNLIIVP